MIRFDIGLLQSTGWPTIVAIMGNWFGKGRCVYVYMGTYVVYMMISYVNWLDPLQWDS